MFVSLFVFFSGFAEEINDSSRISTDSILKLDKKIFPVKEITAFKIDTAKVDTVGNTKFKPDPVKVIWLGAIIPGYGQIANKKYWKLPIVYTGFMGFAYAISWNNSRYNSFKNAYRDVTDSDPSTNSYLDIVPKGYEYIPPGGSLQDVTKIAFNDEDYKRYLNSNQEGFHRYRDMSILLSIGYYAIVLLEAYVDAHLYDFDISPDLVLNVVPSRIQLEHNRKSAYGLQCSIRF